MDEGVQASLGRAGSIDLDLYAIDFGLLLTGNHEDALNGREGVAEFDVSLLDARLGGIDGIAFGFEGRSRLFLAVEASYVVVDLGNDSVELILDASKVEALESFGDIFELVFDGGDVAVGD